MKFKVAPHIQSLIPYPPGKPLEELEREYGISDSIKLASNENAMGPSPEALSAIVTALPNLHRYPDGSCYYLTERLSDKLGVEPEQIIFGNGSNEIIELLCATFLDPDDEAVTSNPTFLMYQKLVQVHGGRNVVIPLKDMEHDLDAILAAVTDRTRLIFLDNPNNPCGTMIKQDAFDRFLEQLPEQVLVVLDEAYIDFVEPDKRIDVVSYVQANKPVVVLRTFSKAYGLAGLRIGYGLMPAEVVGFLDRVRQPFNVNALAQVGAWAALADEEYYQRTIEFTVEGRKWLMEEVSKLGCKPLPSYTNFFLIDVGCNAKELYDRMLHKGVIVRPMQAYGFPNYIRITVGTPIENKRFINALADILQEFKYD
jgi:histidinol-phosphate aminotransferase